MVSLLKWTDDLLIHIDDLDDQHRTLFLLINRLIIHKRTNGPRETLLVLMQVLGDCAQAHFRDEERHMAASHYPLALSHSKEHLEFILTIQEFIKDYDSGKKGLSAKMITYLRHWWATHVAESDQKFGKHLKKAMPPAAR